MISKCKYSSLISLGLITLLGCGGGGSSTTKPNVEPTPDTPVVTPSGPIISGEQVSITVDAAVNNTSHQCHASLPEQEGLQFSEISTLAGLNFSHEMLDGDGILGMTGGVAAGDFDNDGWVDLYAVTGDANENVLLKNLGNGEFSEVAALADVNISAKNSGPAFGDFNNDGLLDLFVGGVSGDKARLFLNQGNEQFLDITDSAGLELPGNNFTGTWVDYDKDNDLDIFITHWTEESNEYYAYFWKNNGDLTFSDASFETGIQKMGTQDKTFTPTFSDIDNDGWQDLLLVADNNQTRVFRNNKNGSFTDITDQDVITDNAGMGSAVGDYDNDGDLDWFVTAISYKDGVTDFGWLTPGNRFYQNQGDGTFIDKTDETGVRHGLWGWATCFSDFNNDGYLDLFHVNGMEGDDIDERFNNDLSRMFIGSPSGTFTEQAQSVGINDDGMGRGIVCFDYDKDGDQDLYIANYNQPPKLYCNHGNNNNFLNVTLVDNQTNYQAIGAKIKLKTASFTQMRELRSGNNYVSQNPVQAHFGLATDDDIESLSIVWPDGKETTINQIDINQFMIIERL